MHDLPVIRHDEHHHHDYDYNSTGEYYNSDASYYYFVFILLYLALSSQLFIFLYMLFRLCIDRHRRRHMIVVLQPLEELDEEEMNRLQRL